jgi:hypothetical protein
LVRRWTSMAPAVALPQRLLRPLTPEREGNHW